MKTLLMALLVCSLVANTVLLLRPRGAPPLPWASAAEASAADTPTTAPSGRRATTAGAYPLFRTEVLAPAWRAPRSDDDLRALAAGLRAAGYPGSVIRAVVSSWLSQRFAARRPDANLPFWKQMSADSEMVAATNALEKERRETLAAILGPDGRTSAMLDPMTRTRHYGDLSDEKIDALAEIERDYRDLNVENWARRRGNPLTDNESRVRNQRLMEEERMADIAALLSPEEAAQYELRNAPAALRLMSDLRTVDVSAEEYAALYEVRKAFDLAHPQPATGLSADYFQRMTAQLEAHEQARTLLGDERFYRVLEASDFNFANVTKSLAAFPAVKPADAFQVMRMQIELQGALSERTRGGALDAQKSEEMRALTQAFNTRLETLLGAEAAAAYRSQGNGRLFNVSRAAPRPGG